MSLTSSLSNGRPPNIPWVRPRVLWMSGDLAACDLEKPSMLCACASPRDVGEWRWRNRWADAAPLALFMGDTADGYAAPHPVAFGPADPGRPQTPYRVDNAPALLLGTHALQNAADTPYSSEERDALGRYLSAVEAVAMFAPQGPTWWIMADSDNGLGAVRVAATRGACVALATAGVGIGPAGAALAQRLGVDIKVTNLAAGRA